MMKDWPASGSRARVIHMTENDFYQDDDNYYVKNFKEIPGVNVAWTRFGDLQLPNLGIFKFPFN